MSLRRVSSRQRLVSWDAFDAQATTGDGSSSEEFAEDYDTCLDYDACMRPSSSSTSLVSSLSFEDELPLKRKRVASTDTRNAPNVIPTEDEEDPKVLDLPVEVQLLTLQFLDLKDLRSVMQVNKASRKVLTQQETSIEAIWKPSYQRQFPFLTNLQDLVDRVTDMNHSVLLSMAFPTHPTKIDESQFCRRKLRRSTTSRVREHALKIFPDGVSVQFQGTVGIGDRCIRSNAPLPRPHKKQTHSSLLSRIRNHHRRRQHKNQFQPPILCRGVGSTSFWKPFVAPTVVDDMGTVDVSPRLISYFEATILKEEDAEAPQDWQPPQRGPLQALRNRTPECVAVGLATDNFHLHSRMPGWDGESFGWHGDDGGIFHNSGSMVRNFGHSFGSSDTIGCGVDYHRRAIFYTRNGEFCGYAFVLKDQHLTQDLYPVIGMDTKCPVRCNFGTERPFMFDVMGMIEKQKELVQSSLGLSKR